MNRRDFLFLRAGRRSMELSCERLYMRWVDATADGTTARLFDLLAGELAQTRSVSLVDTSWLACRELEAALDETLSAFRARGGRVLKGSSC